MSEPELEYTHEALLAAGYVRRPVGNPGPGFVCYDRRGRNTGPITVAWVGNNATMGEWILEVSRWERNFPEAYAWYIDPTQRKPHHVQSTNEVLIKGEDPAISGE